MACQLRAVAVTYLRLVALLEKRILSWLAGRLVLGEVAISADLFQHFLVNALQVHFGRSRNDISCVYPSQRNAVDFEGTGNEEDTLRQMLEEDDSLAAEATSEEDNDGTGLE